MIKLEKSDKTDLKKGECVIIEFQIRPNNNDSSTFDLAIPYVGTGSAEDFWPREIIFPRP